jgi:hypothetical protein
MPESHSFKRQSFAALYFTQTYLRYPVKTKTAFMTYIFSNSLFYFIAPAGRQSGKK